MCPRQCVLICHHKAWNSGYNHYKRQIWESLNRLNGFRMTQLHIKVTQAQGQVSYFYLNPVPQVQF